MDFFSSLNQVRKNSGQLDAWERQQRDKDAQRKAYQAKHAPTPEELEQAQELGETVINAIDIMDDHSESVAENVETVTAPFSTFTLLALGGADAYLAWNLGIKPANKALDSAEKAFDKNQKNIDFVEKVQKNGQYKRPNGQIVEAKNFNVSNLRGNRWSKRIRESITDADLRNEAIEINKTWQKTIKPISRKRGLAIISVPVAAMVGWFMGNIYETKLQVDSSKIARFQARRELNDPKAFVNYTPEQIAKARAELDKHPERIKKKNKNNLKKGMFSSIRELIRDHDNYNSTKKLRAKKQSIVDRPLTQAEILQAKKDQEVIQRVVKHINNEAEKNSEKMEVAANVIMNTFPIVGGLIGWGLEIRLDKSGLIKKWVGKYVEKTGSEEAKTAFKELAKLDKKDPKYKSAWKEFYGEFTGIPQTKKQISNAFKDKDIDKKVEALSKKDEAIKAFKKLFAGNMMHKTRGKFVLGFAASFLAAIPSAIIGLRLQKNAARAGRFTAKRELEQNPENFIGYADSELEEVKDVKSEQKKRSKIKEYALFIPKVLRDYYRYEKYRKTEFKEKQALNAELKKLDVSEEQLRNAKNLQNKLFNTFEKFDDKSQSYSEATEAAIETAQPLVYAGGMFAMISPLFYFGVQAYKGKYTPAKISAKVTNFLATSSYALKSKLFKKYLNSVEKHTAHIINNTDTADTKYSAMLKDIDILETPIADILTRGTRNLRTHLSNEFRNMSNEEQINHINSLYYKFSTKLNNRIPKGINLEEIYNTAAAKAGGDYDIQSAIIDIVYNDRKAIAQTQPEILARAKELIGERNVQLLSRYHNTNELANSLFSLRKSLAEINDPKLRADILDLVTLNKPAIEQMSPENFNNAKNYLIDKILTKNRADNISELLKALSEMQSEYIKGSKLENILEPEVLNKLELIPGMKKAVEELFVKAQNIEIPNKTGDELIEALKNSTGKDDLLSLYDKFPKITTVLNGQNIPIRLKDIPELAQAVSDVAKGAAATGKIPDLLTGSSISQTKLMRMLQNLDVINNPKLGFERLSQYLEKADAETYIKIVQNTPFSGWERESVIKSLGNIAKMWDNIPKEESKRIMQTLIKQFNENPDKFIEAVSSGRIMKIFATPELGKALAIAGVSWTVFTAVMTYAIESWLAEMQLRAGRLGVKTAMDDLQDYRYYANIIPEEQTQSTAQTTPTIETNEKKQDLSTNLLAKFK